jgi:hypothetical protein
LVIGRGVLLIVVMQPTLFLPHEVVKGQNVLLQRVPHRLVKWVMVIVLVVVMNTCGPKQIVVAMGGITDPLDKVVMMSVAMPVGAAPTATGDSSTR